MAEVPSTAGLPSVAPEIQSPDDYQHIEDKIGPATEKLGAGLEDLGKAFYNMQSTKYQSMATETVWKLRNQFNDLSPDQQVAQAPQYEAAVGKIYSYYGDQLPSLNQRNQYMQDTRSLQDRYFAGQFFTAAKQAQKNAITDNSSYVNQTVAGNLTQDPFSEQNFVSALQQGQAAQLHADVADGLIGDKDAIVAGQQKVQGALAKVRIEALMVQPNGAGLALANQTLKRFAAPLGATGAYPELAQKLERLNKGAGTANAVKGAVDSVIAPVLTQYHNVDDMAGAAGDVPALADKAVAAFDARFGDDPNNADIKQEGEENARQGIYAAWNKRHQDLNGLARENVSALQNYIRQNKITDINSLATGPMAGQYAAVPASMIPNLQAEAKQQVPGADVVATDQVRKNFDLVMGLSQTDPQRFLQIHTDSPDMVNGLTIQMRSAIDTQQRAISERLRAGVSGGQMDGAIAAARPVFESAGVLATKQKGQTDADVPAYNQAVGMLRTEVNDYFEKNGRMPDDKTLQGMARAVTLQGFVPGDRSFFGMGPPKDQPVYTLQNQGKPYQIDINAPAAQALAAPLVNEFIKQAGHPPDEATIEAMLRNRYPSLNFTSGQ